MAEQLSFYQRLTNVQTELKAPKNQYNKFGGYSYRNAEDILEAVKPLLKKYELYLRLTDSLELVGDRFYVKAIALITDGKESVYSAGYAREEAIKKGMDGSQITGASSSYARKYALNGLFLIDDTKDSDATNTHEDKGPKKQEPKITTKTGPSTTDLSDVLVLFAQAKDKTELTNLWFKYSKYENENKDITKALTKRSKELGL